MNLHEFWRGVRETLDALPGDKGVFHLVSLDHREKGITGGVIIEAVASLAAKLIFSKTHRLATPKEIDAHNADMAQRREQIHEAEIQRKDLLSVRMPPQLQALVELAANNTQAAAKGKDK